MAYVDTDVLVDYISDREIIELCDEERLAGDETDLTAAIVLNPKIQIRIDRAISSASSKINSYVRKRYEVPVRIDTGTSSTPANTPDAVQDVCAQLAIVALFKRRQGQFSKLPEGVEAVRKEAMSALKGINAGDIDLGLTPAPAASEYVIATGSGEDRLFTEETLKDY